MSVNRASEVWKEIKPFAIRDMNRMVDNKAGDSGDDLYAIILYDESAQKIKYYSFTNEGLLTALKAASSGDIIWIPPGTLGGFIEYPAFGCTPSNTKCLDLGNGNSGNNPPEGWNTIEFDDSAWDYARSTGTYDNDVNVPPAETISLQTTSNGRRGVFRHVFEAPPIGNAALLTWDGDDWTNGVYVNGILVDQWLSAAYSDDHPPRSVDISEIINYGDVNIICIDQYDTNPGAGLLVSWVVKVTTMNDITINSGVEIVGSGKNSIIDADMINEGILTNIQVTGSISGSGICRMVPNPTAEVFSSQIKSMVVTGTSPFSIASTTVNTNLNGDLLDGKHASAFAEATHTHVEADITNLSHNAKKIDGIDVDTDGITDGQVLVYDFSAEKFLPEDQSGGGGGGSGGSTSSDWMDYIDGSLIASTDAAGAYIVPRDCTIDRVMIHCKEKGSAGSTVIDVNKNGSTIFTTQANRPELEYDSVDEIAISGTPDIVDLDAGDVLTIDIDQAATGAEGLSFIVAMTVNPTSIGSLDDVDLTGIVDGNVLVWDDVNSKFIVGEGGGGSGGADILEVQVFS